VAAHVAELVGATSAEVLGTATFYEMFKFEPVGKYLINICGTMSCALMGAEELMHHAEERLGVKAGGTTPDGLFTLEHAECQAACTEAPCLQVNYRYAFRVTNADLDTLIDDLRAGTLDGEIPAHGTLARVRQSIPADKAAGVVTPKLLDYQGLRGAGAEYAYEALNFVDGKRNAQQICDALSAEYGPVPIEMVVEYLLALERIAVIAQRS